MHWICKRPVLVFPVFLLWAVSSARADGPFIGAKLGVSEPTNTNYRAHVETGGTGAPFAGYMFNDYLGLQGELHFTFQPPDRDSRRFNPKSNIDNETQTTTMFGGTIGPRLQIPLGELVNVYVTGQGGGFKGLGGRLNQWAPGFLVGGGLDVNLTRNVAVGLYGDWDRAYMAPHPTFLVADDPTAHGPRDARSATAGIALTYSFGRPAAPPPPPPPPPRRVAQAPPPPPPAPVEKKKIVLRSVHFDFDKSVIRPDAVPVLNEAVDVLKAQGGVAVIVDGHTDSVGSDAYNLKLSRRRADAVKQYLMKHEIPSNHITTEGFGKSHPVASNDTADGRAQNRRVELRVE